MAEMNRENARLIEVDGRTLEDCVNILLEYQERGESVYIEFWGHKLYSCDVTMDSAYQEILGTTKAEFDKMSEEIPKELTAKFEEKQDDVKSKIPDWVKQGESLIYPERLEEWKTCVESRAATIYSGNDLDAALAIMEKLESGASLDEAKKLLDSQDHSGFTSAMTKRIVFAFSKRGPEFLEYVDKDYLSSEDRKAIEDKKRENAELEALHREDSAKEGSDRTAEEKEILNFSAEKQALQSEINTIEEELKDLKDQHLESPDEQIDI